MSENVIETEKKKKQLSPEQQKQKAIRKEMKQILLGRFDKNADVLMVSDDRMTHFGNGVSDGAWRVGLLGISAKRRRYVSVSEPKKFTEKVWEALGDMGRAVFLTEAPELTVCLVRSVLHRPGLICFEMKDRTPEARVYTGRGLFSFIPKRYYLKKLEKMMDGSLIRDKEPEKVSTEGTENGKD